MCLIFFVLPVSNFSGFRFDYYIAYKIKRVIVGTRAGVVTVEVGLNGDDKGDELDFHLVSQE